jgi:hypothetical protein
MASGAGAGFFASVFDLDIVREQGIANGLTARSIDHDAFRAESGMGQYDDLGHLVYLGNRLSLYKALCKNFLFL